DDLLHWLTDAAEGLPADFVASPPATANEILEKSDQGIPYRALTHICWRGAVPWSQVQSAVTTPSVPPVSPITALTALAREYDQIRETQEPGGERSEAMRSVAARMRPVCTIEPATIQSLT